MKEDTISITKVAEMEYGYAQEAYVITGIYTLPSGYYGVFTVTPETRERILVSDFSVSPNKNTLLETWLWFTDSSGSTYGVFEKIKTGRIKHTFVKPNTGDIGDVLTIYVANQGGVTIDFGITVYMYIETIPENISGVSQLKV